MLVKNHELQQHSSHLALHCYLTAFHKLTAVDSGHNVNFYIICGIGYQSFCFMSIQKRNQYKQQR